MGALCSRKGSLSTFPTVVSIGALIAAIDRNTYSFVRRDDRAVGFVGGAFASHEIAEKYTFERRDPPSRPLRRGPCAIIFAVQAISADVTRYLCRRLRADVFRDKHWLYFFRDYGQREDGGHRMRGGRVQRPAVRRAARNGRG